MKSLLASLEGYNNPIDEDDFLKADTMIPDNDEDEDDFLLTKISVLLEDSKEIQENADQIEAMDDVLDEVDASVERLTAIRNTVEKYGICRGIMEISDPKHEVVEEGICCAYEELSISPMKDADAQTVITGLESAIEAILQKVKNTIERRQLLDDNQRVATYDLLSTLSAVDWKNYDSAIICGKAIMVHTYDKVKWHLSGKDHPDLEAVKTHIESVMHWLKKHEMLTEEGLGALKDGVDSEFIITDTMMNVEGNRVMKKCYSQWLKNCKYGEEPSMEKLEKCSGKS